MPVGIGSCKARCDFCAVNRIGFHAKSLKQDGNIKSAEVKDLGLAFVFQEFCQIWRLLLTFCNLNDVSAAVTW